MPVLHVPPQQWKHDLCKGVSLVDVMSPVVQFETLQQHNRWIKRFADGECMLMASVSHLGTLATA